MEKELDSKGKSKEEIQKTLSDPNYIKRWLTSGRNKRTSSGIINLSNRIADSYQVKSYQRQGKVVRGHRQSRKSWTENEKQQLFQLSQRMNLHEISRVMGRSYESVRRKRQELRK